MKLLTTFFVFVFTVLNTANAQTPIELHISHKLGGINPFTFNQQASNDLGNDFNVTRLEYYISKIKITHDGGMTTDIPNHYILVDGSQDVTDNLGMFNITNVESVSFYVGVDTPINHADPSLQPMGHPLAPKSPSMHWGWTSGYRFVAIEGKSGNGLSQTFEVHALGDQHYFMTTVNTTGVSKGGKIIIPIHADYVQALKGIDISSGLIAHGDGGDEAKLLNNFKNDVFSAGFPVSVNETIASVPDLVIYPNPSFENVASIAFGSYSGAADISIVDVQGRTVKRVRKTPNDNTVKIQLQNTGLYFVKVLYANGSYVTSKLQLQ